MIGAARNVIARRTREPALDQPFSDLPQCRLLRRRWRKRRHWVCEYAGSV